MKVYECKNCKIQEVDPFEQRYCGFCGAGLKVIKEEVID